MNFSTPISQLARLSRAALALYRAKTLSYPSGERLAQDCIDKAIAGFEGELPEEFCNRLEALMLDPSIDLEEAIEGECALILSCSQDACAGIDASDLGEPVSGGITLASLAEIFKVEA